MTHYGDPCIHCGTAHDDVPPGDCVGDPKKAVPVTYASLGVRWDQVEGYVARMSDGRIEEVHEQVPYRPYFGLTYDESLKQFSRVRYVNGRTVILQQRQHSPGTGAR